MQDRPRPRPLSPTLRTLTAIDNEGDEVGLPDHIWTTTEAIYMHSHVVNGIEADIKRYLEQNPLPELPEDDLEPIAREPSPDKGSAEPESSVPEAFTAPRSVNPAGVPVKDPVSTRTSLLTSEEHVKLSELDRKYREEQITKISCMTPDEHIRYQELRATALAEQRDYLEACYQSELLRKENYMKVSKNVKEQVEEVIRQRKLRAKNYARYYQPHSNVQIGNLMYPQQDAPVFRRQGQTPVLQVGYCLQGAAPSPGFAFHPEIAVRRGLNDPPLERVWTKVTMPTISEDAYVDKLCHEHNIDIALSSSVLSTIVDMQQPGFEQGWDIPIVVKQHEGRNIVYMDKPFLKRKYNSRERSQLYFQTAFQSAATVLDAQTAQVMKAFSDPTLAGCECFPAEAPTIPSVSLSDHNLTYQIWTFGALKILIRCKMHGYVMDSHPRGYSYIGYKSKLEYQPHRNFEDFSLSEITRWWLYSLLRTQPTPGGLEWPDLLVGRINPYTSSIIKVDRISISSLSQQHPSFKLEPYCYLFYVLLKQLKQLDKGTFLLSHKANEKHISISKGVEEEHFNTFDLHSWLISSGALDPDVFPYIRAQFMPRFPGHFPYTFTPRDFMRHNNSVLTAGKPRMGPPVGEVAACHEFMRSGTCKRGPQCKFTHLTAAEFTQMRAQQQHQPGGARPQRGGLGFRGGRGGMRGHPQIQQPSQMQQPQQFMSAGRGKRLRAGQGMKVGPQQRGPMVMQQQSSYMSPSTSTFVDMDAEPEDVPIDFTQVSRPAKRYQPATSYQQQQHLSAYSHQYEDYSPFDSSAQPARTVSSSQSQQQYAYEDNGMASDSS